MQVVLTFLPPISAISAEWRWLSWLDITTCGATVRLARYSGLVLVDQVIADAVAAQFPWLRVPYQDLARRELLIIRLRNNSQEGIPRAGQNLEDKVVKLRLGRSASCSQIRSSRYGVF